MIAAGTFLPRDPQGFRFDLNSCTGCSACELACSTENQLGWGHSWRQVITFNAQRLPSLPTYHLSLACNHCHEAPCIRACPALAIERDERTGAVLIEQEHCVGCRYCSWACPYEAPRFDERVGVMGKCTGCDQRLAESRDPACVEQCPTDALTFGALQGAETVIGFPVTEARPAIRFVPLRAARQQGPECSWQYPREVVDSFAASRPEPADAISLSTEWPLWIFTSIASLLVGWVLASLASLNRPDPVFLGGMAAIAAGASTLHLGKKWRAWRTFFNLRHSWLSREIVFFTLFAGASLLYCALPDPLLVPGLVAATLGVATLVSVDRVYDCVRPVSGVAIHSADTVLTGLLVGALLLGSSGASLILLAVKLILYAGRRLGRVGVNRNELARKGWAPPMLRVGLGFMLPVLLWKVGPGSWPVWALAGIAMGEILDRAEFYNELEIVTASGQMAADLEKLRQTSSA